MCRMVVLFLIRNHWYRRQQGEEIMFELKIFWGFGWFSATGSLALISFLFVECNCKTEILYSEITHYFITLSVMWNMWNTLQTKDNIA